MRVKVKPNVRRAAYALARTTKRGLLSTSRISKHISVKTFQYSKKVAIVVHHRTAIKPHELLFERFKLYRNWHTWRIKKFHHGHLHGVLALSWGLFIIFMVSSVIGQVSAMNYWQQSNWSGGVGDNTDNQYSSLSGITVNNNGKLEISKQTDWCNNANCDQNWQYRKKINFDNTDSNIGTTSEQLTNFPVLIKLNQSIITYNHFKSDGSDVRFTDQNGVDLPYEIEKWDTAADSYIWLKVPIIAQNSNSSYAYMYYGNQNATNHQAPNNVWSNNFRGVYHLNQTTGTSLLDSTTNAKNGTKTSSTKPSALTSGKIGIAQLFDGSSSVDLPSMNANKTGGSKNTISLWINWAGGGEHTVFAWGNSFYDLIFANTQSANPNQRCFGFNTGNGDCYGMASNGLVGGWNYVTAVFNNGSLQLNRLYINGVQQPLTQILNSPRSNSVINDSGMLGRLNSAGYYFLGAMDEFRLAVDEPTAAWIAADYKSNNSQFVNFNDEQYIYLTQGTLTSSIYDLTFGGDWGMLTYSYSGSGNVVVRVRTSNSATMTGAPDFTGCPVITSGTDLTGSSCVTDDHRYIQYQVTLSSAGLSTPVFEDLDIQYVPWDNIPPLSNASNIVMKKGAGGSLVQNENWTNEPFPYFEWTSASDNNGGSGIKGYCLYLGQDNTSDPVSTKGNLGTSPLDTEGACQFAVSGINVDTATTNFIGTALTTSNTPYYLNVKAIDNANNVFTGSVAQFQFRYDNIAPTNPSFVTAPSQFVASKEVTLTWPTSGGDAASDANSGLVGLQYRIGNTAWYGDSHSGAQDATDILTNDGTYTTTNTPDYDNINEGNNIVYFRTWDAAGNVSSVYTTTVIKLNTSSPSSPQNVTATPSTNTTNSFAFSWAAPSSFLGSASNITYCYTVNTLPTSNTCTYTPTGVTSLDAGAYANQPGENTIYVVARDEASNINYATAASTTFIANTSAPGIPLDLDIADVSTKATSTWRLALSWNAPTNVGAGVSSYRIYRSTDNVNFSPVASTSGTSYVDGGLSQRAYYYKLKACDSANNCGADSSVVNDLPTGRFTSPANLTAEPSVSGVGTKRALVRWSTDRNSASTVSIGTSAGNYQPFQIASNSQTTDHKIELNNLTPGTTYYAKASWTDEDGNTGNSSEFIFKTEPAPSTQEVEIRRTTLSSAQIRFTSVSAAKVVIQYGLSDGFGGVKEIATSLEKSTYDVELVGLNDDSKYFFRLNTFDADGNEYVGSTVLTFTTPARPAISNLRFQPLEDEPTSTQRVTWTTNVPTSSLVRYSAANVPAKEISVSDLDTEHEVVIKDLVDDTEYNFIAESRDKDGNLAVSDTQVLRTALDTRPPKISDISVEASIKGTGAEARGQVVVSWKTDEPATSQVAFSEGNVTEDLNSRTAEDGTLSTEHIVVVSDLPTSKIYSVQPIAKDGSGNTGFGDINSAIIGRASDSVITIVLNTLRRVFGF